VRSRYLGDCVKARRRIPLDPRYMLFGTEETRKRFITDTIADEFDDIYRVEHTPESLKEVSDYLMLVYGRIYVARKD
jgi:DNA ligase-4